MSVDASSVWWTFDFGQWGKWGIFFLLSQRDRFSPHIIKFLDFLIINLIFKIWTLCVSVHACECVHMRTYMYMFNQRTTFRSWFSLSMLSWGLPSSCQAWCQVPSFTLGCLFLNTDKWTVLQYRLWPLSLVVFQRLKVSPYCLKHKIQTQNLVLTWKPPPWGVGFIILEGAMQAIYRGRHPTRLRCHDNYEPQQ